MNAHIAISRIEARLIADDERSLVLPRHFGHRAIFVEDAIFRWLRQLSEYYHGGSWRMFELSNHGYYMAPEMDRVLPIEVGGNGFSGRMSADAAGITACLFAYSHLSFEFPDARLDFHYQRLLAFADQHHEASAIFSAID